MDPTSATAELLNHVTTGALVVYGIEALKKLPQFSWITTDTKWLNRIVSALAAAAVSLGINYTGNADTGWIIHIPAAIVLWHGVVEWAHQIVLQQLVYAATIESKTVTVQHVLPQEKQP